jgi:hypothetical protein
MKKPLPPGLHLILGDSAGGIFNRVFGPVRDRLLVDLDPLSCGPTLSQPDLDAWWRMRSDFWNSLVVSEPDYRSFPNPVIQHVDRLRAPDGVTIWAATGLNEQLFIAHALHLADEMGVPPEQLRLVLYETLRNRRARVLGMGELNEEYMASHPDPRALTPNELMSYRGLWDAMTSADPHAFENFAARNPAANTYQVQAAKLMLRRFPERQSGLPYWDKLLLELTATYAPRPARIIGGAFAHDCSDGDFIGDGILFDRMHRLADPRLSKPLLEFSDFHAPMRDTQVSLTPFGRQVLEGKASNYPTNQIDDWVGGVRLSSVEGAIWFNDRGTIIAG